MLTINLKKPSIDNQRPRVLFIIHSTASESVINCCYFHCQQTLISASSGYYEHLPWSVSALERKIFQFIHKIMKRPCLYAEIRIGNVTNAVVSNQTHVYANLVCRRAA